MIDFTTKLIKKFKDAGFFPDTMFTCLLVLDSLENGNLDVLDALDDASTSKRMLLLYFDLIRRGLIESAPDNLLALYKITEKGTQFLNSLNEEDVPETTEDWIEDWIELWPKGVTSGGKLVRPSAI